MIEILKIPLEYTGSRLRGSMSFAIEKIVSLVFMGVFDMCLAIEGGACLFWRKSFI